ncbi:MAG: DUF4197 domain-containing protein [Deltaproteobacteria bacterium]|nr:DUF4197 domain-containing protein [Deltaproteobacteria bacterium]
MTRANRGAMVVLCAVILLSGAGGAAAGLWDALKDRLLGSSPTQSAPLTTGEISQGLLQALSVGAEKAVGRASAAGGFLDNPTIHISLPKPLQRAGSTLRAVGLGTQVDELETALNRGAEKASAQALPIFLTAIRQLTFQDVEAIWKGGDDAATRYLREKTGEPLFSAFEPVVHDAVREVGVTRLYDSLTANPLARVALSGSDWNLDTYATTKALDGVFTLLAEEEKKIRTDPVARTTELLQRVFGL